MSARNRREAPLKTLASSRTFRRVRRAVFRKLFPALADYADEELRVVTVIKSSQRIQASDLLMTSAKRLKAQFAADLKRSGVASMPGPLIAFLHGEFESTAGVFVVHWHLVTTAEKADALQREFGKLRTYPPTPTGSPAILVQKMNNRAKQLTYLLLNLMRAIA